jgi:hypothetical protein
MTGIDRKAGSALMARGGVGSAVLGGEVEGYAVANNPRKWTGAYVDTQDYGGKEPDLNVRLGAWLANPAAEIQKTEVKAGPTSALKPLLTEALGLTDAKRANVYLSDGGHFDDLGIYEMIRRRCRYILVVDAGASLAGPLVRHGT